jgi:hypothetical protein
VRCSRRLQPVQFPLRTGNIRYLAANLANHLYCCKAIFARSLYRKSGWIDIIHRSPVWLSAAVVHGWQHIFSNNNPNTKG